MIDNWDVIGLRGTGSIDYTMRDVFVPEGYSHFAVAHSARGGSLYHLGIIGFATICHSGWALGVGRRLLDELAPPWLGRRPDGQVRCPTATLPRRLRPGGGDLPSRPRARSTRRGATCSTTRQRRAASVRQHTLIRLALTHVTQALHDVANFVYLSAGTTSLRRGTIQRLLRDVHAGTQHVTSSPPVVQTCGALAGLAPNASWRFLELIDA